jgi:hypothetical protein
MAFTRFKDDPDRIAKQLQQQTDVGRWHINVPGPGDNLPFMEDSHILAQKWGGNIHQNTVDIQSTLLGLNKKINRDDVNQSQFKRQNLYSIPMTYPTHSNFLTTEQSRAIMPAWTAKDLQQNHAYILPDNPQEHVEIPFHNFMSTRNAEKDQFNRNLNCIQMNDQRYTLPVFTNENKDKPIKNIIKKV